MTENKLELIVITGASSGIGLEIAKQQALLPNRHIVCVARYPERLQQAIDSLQSHETTRLSYFCADLSSKEDIANLFQYVQTLTLPLKGLVHCAGGMFEAALMMSKAEAMESQYLVHVQSAFLLAQGASKLMMRPRDGSMVFLSSVVAQQGAKGQSVYSSMKAAVSGFVASFALEVGRMGIRVNAISPGFIDTPLTSHFSAEAKSRFASQTALGRIGEVEDVANLASFLLSSKSRYITGQTIAIDGGFKVGV